ncbi:MAG: DEAD/DEAH box helicase family protein, partial [Alphaproteobacteria bacterium]|nr:DEAD/DEAH box helicase family protein [Alphaproteobacteria bacterium]
MCDYSNFKILEEKIPQLAEIGKFAEEYIYSDPQSSISKTRLFAESFVKILCRTHNIEADSDKSFYELLTGADFKQIVPTVILDKLHIVRRIANRAIHGNNIRKKEAEITLKQIYDISKWLAIVYLKANKNDVPDFIISPKETKKADEAKTNKDELKLQQTLKELEETKQELKALYSKEKASNIATEELKYNEADTRKYLIDLMIKEAGWNISFDGSDTEEVKQEDEVLGQPTKTGTGYSDYVFYGDNGKPLAVIEAKRTSINPETGKTQAKLYADALEKKYEQRPVIFYTNGFETYIWDDAQNCIPRKIWGIYSKDSLERLIFQRQNKLDIKTAQPDSNIAGRGYQIRAIKAITEHFTHKKRKALIVQATGTGKTRVAISLTKLLLEKRWAKKILFLCDRNALQKQAKNSFNEFLGTEPLTILNSSTKNSKENNIFFATYPSMMRQFSNFDVGYFDLIIADESHRSIYNIYGDIFKYFDCLQIGLTATPVGFINRNTFSLFNCDAGNPTALYELEEAIEQKYLVQYIAYSQTTLFQRDGIYYDDLPEKERKKLEEDGEDSESIDYKSTDLDKNVFNKPTNQIMIRNLVENGIKDKDNQFVGKSIVFARNHDHAVLMQKLFEEMYPQYNGFCEVIDYKDGRAETLIGYFKDPNNKLRIAISVDMLDTGID